MPADTQAPALDVLQPTLYEVGRRWSYVHISVAQEHLATAATQFDRGQLTPAMAAMAAEHGAQVVALSAALRERFG
jgi:B12 binding domain